MKRTMNALIVFFAVLTPLAWADSDGVGSLRKTSQVFAKVAKQVSPAVVMIQVEKQISHPNIGGMRGGQNPFEKFFDEEEMRRFFGDPRRRMPQRQPSPRRQPPNKFKSRGQGSGFIISADGYILTNNHVVGGADLVKVKLQDGREFKAKIVGTDPHSDVAVIKIEGTKLPVLVLGDSDAMEVGEWVLAVGNPFGLSHTLTAGIVSAKGRSSVGIADYENFIQTDAAINPGNSGGPLVNLDGKAVGINTAIFSQSGGYMGIGFAIPINMVKIIKNQLIKDGSMTRGFLGVVIQPLSPDLAEDFNVKDGIIVSQVQPGSAADKGGIELGDVIVELNGKTVRDVGAFRNTVSMKRPGTVQKLVVMRDGKRKPLDVKIGKLPEKGGEVAGVEDEAEAASFGMTVVDITKDAAASFRLKGRKGVLIAEVEPGSIAAEAGLATGQVIKQANRKRVTTVAEFKKVIDKSPKRLLLLVEDARGARYIVLKK